MPETISKFLPAKVINSGTALLAASQYNIISTGIRMIWSSVSFRRSSLSVNDCPFLLISNAMIEMKAGATANVNLGGIPEVLVKKLLKAKRPVTVSHTIIIMVAVFLFLVELMKSSPVKITVSKNVIVM
jgi:hypothetical protein